MKLNESDRRQAAKDAVDRMPKEHIEIWKSKLAKTYRSFDAYCNSCSKIFEITCRISTLEILLKKSPVLGPPSLLSPRGTIVCTCRECANKYIDKLK